MKNSEIAFLDFSPTSLLEKENIVNIIVYKPLCSLFRIINIFIHKKIKQKENPTWLSKCSDYNTIIVFDSRKNYKIVCHTLEEKYANLRLIFYAWNPLSYSSDYKELSDRWEKYSFSKKDSRNSGFKYAGPFYFPSLVLSTTKIKYEGVFIGQNKGRINEIYSIAKLFDINGFNAMIKIVDNRRALFSTKYTWYMPYSKICEYISSSICIIDIVQSNQEGMTLRVMESLFFKKKLVTNNSNIKTYDFYNSNNIFIYGVDNVNEFSEFIKSPYQKLDDNILGKYSFDGWLKRIINGENE